MKEFPVMIHDYDKNDDIFEGCPLRIPWKIVAPFEPQAIANHSQTLERLAERGGLCPEELYAVMHGLGYKELRALNRETVRDWLRTLLELPPPDDIFLEMNRRMTARAIKLHKVPGGFVSHLATVAAEYTRELLSQKEGK